jgi:hypothetical protein
VLRLTGAFLLLCVLLCGHSQAAELRPVVWDGFAYPYKPGAPERCDESLNPSCAIYSDDAYQARFWNKLQSIKDDKYKFVSWSEETGESLHVAVSIGLEWKLKGGVSEPDIYYFCATVLLYNASETLTLVNSTPNCWQQRVGAAEQANWQEFLRGFLYADPNPAAQTVEKRLLAEIAEIISSKPGDLVRIAVRNVTAQQDLFKNEPGKRDLLGLYATELFSAYTSSALGRPVIPASSNTGLMDLRFSDNSRKSLIRLPLSSHSIDLHIHPFGKDVYKDNLGLKYERAAAFMRVNHEFIDGSSSIPSINFGTTTVPRRVYDDLAPELDELKNLNLLHQLIFETAAQLAKPDKEWLKAHVVKVSADKVFPGLEALARDLKR